MVLKAADAQPSRQEGHMNKRARKPYTGAPARSGRKVKAPAMLRIQEERAGITPEQRRRLAECCAFFVAERFREAAPGEIRRGDIEAAAAELDATIRKCSDD
jgi:hypothetical protein